jgi:hypothetical protein
MEIQIGGQSEYKSSEIKETEKNTVLISELKNCR